MTGSTRSSFASGRTMGSWASTAVQRHGFAIPVGHVGYGRVASGIGGAGRRIWRGGEGRRQEETERSADASERLTSR
jgi:hypothetical protein